jgi:hypothetical protein
MLYAGLCRNMQPCFFMPPTSYTMSPTPYTMLKRMPKNSPKKIGLKENWPKKKATLKV